MSMIFYKNNHLNNVSNIMTEFIKKNKMKKTDTYIHQEINLFDAL